MLLTLNMQLAAGKELVNFIFVLPVIFMLPNIVKKLFFCKVVTVLLVWQDNNAQQF